MNDSERFDEQFYFAMEGKLKNLPEYFSFDDTLFHYTNFTNGILITSSQKLRVSSRKKSKDPIESLPELFGSRSSSSNDKETLKIEERTDYEVKELELLKDEMENNMKQVCFCVNDIENSKLGFLKPRMWNQYGDDYNGVCLIFSKQELLDENKGIIVPELCKNINYIGYHELRKDFIVNRNEILKDEKGEYLTKYRLMIRDKLFQKHYDYSGENEFRILTKSKNKFDELDIKKSLRGVLISVIDIKKELSKIQYFQNLCDDNNIDFRIIKWKSDGFEILLRKSMSEIHKVDLSKKSK
jgi:hypothetical protein